MKDGERSDFDVDRNRRRDSTGSMERISVSNSDGIFAIIGRGLLIIIDFEVDPQ